MLARFGGPLFGHPGGDRGVPFAPPSIPGLGQFGGFEFQVLDQSGTDINALAAATYAMVGAGNASPRLAGLFSSFTANDPQLTVEIDRERALALGVPLSEITSALQIYIGSQYVNDFDFNNRAYRVYVQADQRVPRRPGGARQAVRPQSRRADAAARERGAHEGDDRAAGHQPLQPVPVGDHQRLGDARIQLGPGARGDGARRRSRRCRRA